MVGGREMKIIFFFAKGNSNKTDIGLSQFLETLSKRLNANESSSIHGVCTFDCCFFLLIMGVVRLQSTALNNCFF